MNAGPLFIAIVGAPETGKSTFQEILCERFGVIPVDDGRPLRDAAKSWFGLTEWHVSTQSGKRSTVEIGGKVWTVRDILGRIGDKMEELFGDAFVPTAATQPLRLDPDKIYSFGSVRKSQPRWYKARGGVVVEMVRRGFEPVNGFDRYDADAVDFSIINIDRAGWREHLADRAADFMAALGRHRAA